MRPTLVLLVVGLTPRHLGPHTPQPRRAWRARARCGRCDRDARGHLQRAGDVHDRAAPRDHGIVGNGWLFRDLMEIWLWRQSNRLVGGEKIWEAGKRRDPAFTCANMFWWYNMAATA